MRLAGKSPGNAVIRMGVDPMCGKVNDGKRVLQEAVVTSDDGGLANVFVKLQGSFPSAPAAPSAPVVIDQKGCVYAPRVVGVRVGQTLEIRNDDPLNHNVHSLSAKGNVFNVVQGKAGVVSSFKMKDEEMFTVKCDVHRWMNAFVGVVSHPYFAVSGDGGSFEIRNLPPGTHTIQAWHEKYGTLTKTISVKAGTVSTAEFTYQ